MDEGRVYTLGAMGDLYCLNAETGAVVWSRDLKQDYKTSAPQWGFCGHPLVDGDKLICLVGGAGSVAVAFDKRTGKELWRALSAKETGYSAPTLVTFGGRRQLLIWHAEALVGLDPDTGKQFWSVPLEPDYGMAISTPRQLGEFVFVGAIKDKSLLVRLAADPPSAEAVWRGTARISIGPVSSPSFLQDGHLYGFDRGGDMRCVRLSDGERLWTTFQPTTGDRRADSFTTFLVKQGDRFFLTNEKGEIIIARLSPKGYEEISRGKLLDPTTDAFGRKVVWSHPAYANRCIFARNDKEVVCASLAAK